jgi:hypothetical protein
MLFGETVAVYCENHTEHTNTMHGKNSELANSKLGGIYIYHWGFNRQNFIMLYGLG